MAGAPVRLVLLHPVGLSSAVWDLVPGLKQPDRWRLVCHDFRGHGSRPRPDGPFTVADLAADVAAQLTAEAASTDRRPRTVLAGLSLGGMAAQLVAARHPGLVDALILADTVSGAPETMRTAVRRRAERCAAGGMAAVSEETIGRWFTAGFREREPGTVARVRSWLLAADPVAHAWTWEAIAGFRAEHLLPGVDVPALVVCGSEDTSTPPSSAAALARLLPRATLAEMAGAGHLAPVEQPDEFARLVSDFLDTVLGGPEQPGPPGSPVSANGSPPTAPADREVLHD